MKLKKNKLIITLISLILLVSVVLAAPYSYAWFTSFLNGVNSYFLLNGEIKPDVFGRDIYYSGSDTWGTSTNNPYYINNINHYKNLYTLNNLGKLGNNYFFKLGNDIDFQGTTAEPIGNETYPFLDYFDGNGKTLSNLFVRSNKIDIGVFGCIGRVDTKIGEVKNLILQNISIASYASPMQIVGHYFSSKEHTEARHIGVFCGHLDGRAGNISIMNASIDLAESTAQIDHYSKYGTIGICSTQAEIFNGSTYSQVPIDETIPGAGKDVGYLYIDHYYEGIRNSGLFPDFYSSISGTTINIKQNHMLPAVGVFTLISGNANSNTMQQFSSSGVSTIYYTDVINVTSGGSRAATTSNTTQIDITNVNIGDSDSVKNFKNSIVNPYNNFSRITNFKDGIILAKYASATYTILNVDGTYKTPNQTAAGTTGVVKFTIDYTKSDVVDILALFRNTTNNSTVTLSIREVNSSGYVGATPIFNLSSNINQQITGAYLKFNHDTLYGSGTTKTIRTYAFCDDSSAQSSVQMVYFAVGGQTGGEGGNDHENLVVYQPLDTIDFIYDVLIPVNHSSFVKSLVIPYFKDGTADIPIDNIKVEYMRTKEGTTITFNLTVTGGDANERALFNYVDYNTTDVVVVSK